METRIFTGLLIGIAALAVWLAFNNQIEAETCENMTAHQQSNISNMMFCPEGSLTIDNK